MPIELTVDQQNFQIIKARLKEAGAPGGLLNRELNKALKAAAKPIQEAEKSAALQLPAAGAVSTGLRASIADATSIRVSNSRTNPGVTVYVQRNKVRGRIGTDTNRARGWKHPVFGNRSVWVQQVMSPGWWGRAGRPGLLASKEKVRLALETVAQKIAKG